MNTEYERWLAQDLEDPDLAEELRSIAGNAAEIKDRFYQDLEFGTGGLRGILGAGTNRINIHTIRKATQGLANYLNRQGPDAHVAIGYDSRIKSRRLPKRRRKCWLPIGITAISIPS